MTRAEKAKQYFLEGYNCSQAVVLAFSDLTGLDKDTAAKVSSGFGGGMGRLREVCGSVSGAVFVLSALFGYSDPKDYEAKKRLYSEIQTVANRFKEQHGSIVCRELLGLKDGAPTPPTPEARTPEFYKKRPCPEIIESCAAILEDYINNRNK